MGWAEASGWDDPDRDITNPSVLAALAMVNRYWGVADQEGGDAWPQVPIGTLDELKDALRDDTPVFLVLGLTPDGHPTSTEYAMMSGGVPEVSAACQEMGPHSGVMGTMLPYAAFAAAEGRSPLLLSESVFVACRVAGGYDDRAGTMFLHDPS